MILLWRLAQGDATPVSLRAALDSVFRSPAYRWAETPAALRWLRDWWQRLGDWLEGLRAGNPVAFRLLAWALLIGLLLVLAHGIWVVWRTVRGAAAPEAAGARAAPGEARDAAWYLREADRAAGAGRMGDALQLAFVALALTLDAQGLLRYHASKTPAECAREARLGREDRERLRELVRVLYAHVFGGRPCAPDDYSRWRKAITGPWHAPAH